VTNWVRSWWSRLTAGLALVVVASVTGVISYTHVYDLTVSLHQPVMVARLMPFGVDGLIVVGSVVLLQAAPGQTWLGWLGVVPGVAASLFANVESGLRWGPLAAGWAGVPAASFALATFLLERWLKAQASHGGRTGTEDAPGHGGRVGEYRLASQCPHAVAATVEEAVVLAFLHARDCAEAPLSQRHLATAFGLSRPKVAELVGPLLAEVNGHHVGVGTAGSVP
jgi:Protein of unknown function (DUF2637)